MSLRQIGDRDEGAIKAQHRDVGLALNLQDSFGSIRGRFRLLKGCEGNADMYITLQTAI
jgi:hypothetical protein